MSSALRLLHSDYTRRSRLSALERPFTLKCYHMSGWLKTELKMAYKNNLIDFLLHWVLGVLGLVMIRLKSLIYTINHQSVFCSFIDYLTRDFSQHQIAFTIVIRSMVPIYIAPVIVNQMTIGLSINIPNKYKNISQLSISCQTQKRGREKRYPPHKKSFSLIRTYLSLCNSLSKDEED